MWKLSIVLVLCLAELHISVSEKKLACEHKKLNLNCPVGQVLKIQSAKYGRDQGDVKSCYRRSVKVFWKKIKSSNCEASSTLGKVKASCNDKSKCSVSSSNALFGDPCRGIYKYLRVVYNCISAPQTKVACERKNLKMECPKGQILRVQSAKYGRDKGDGKTCYTKALRRHRLRIRLHNCESLSAFKKVKANCNDKAKCIVPASNTQFGDPCKGISKYLRVEFDCVPKPSTKVSIPKAPNTPHTPNTPNTDLICEQKHLHMKCQDDEILRIQSAKYDRELGEEKTCFRQSLGLFTVRVKLNNCEPSSDLEEIMEACNDWSECSLPTAAAANDDSCKGTFRYLSVAYRCIPESLQDYERYPETKYPGNDIEKLTDSSLDKCAQTCNDEDECEGFVYHEDKKTCFTKYHFDENDDSHFSPSKDTSVYIKVEEETSL